jgi:hypothetical protein
VPAWTWACSRLADHWHSGFASYYDQTIAPVVVEYLEQASPESDRVCVLDQKCYPFMGSRRQFQVFQRVYIPSPDSLMVMLEHHQISIIVVRLNMNSTEWNGFKGFDECLARHPHRFELIAASARLAVYRFIRAGDTARGE